MYIAESLEICDPVLAFDEIMEEIGIEQYVDMVFYRSLQSINKSEASGDADGLCIGTSFRGFRAFAKNRETWRE